MTLAFIPTLEEYTDEDGEIHVGVHPATAPIAARTRDRLDQNGAEVLCDIPLVSPLDRQPSLKERIASMMRSGELAAEIRRAQNMADDDDDNYDGFDRNFAEDFIPTEHEVSFDTRLNKPKRSPKAATEPPQAPEGPPATTPPPTSENEA